MSGQSISQNIFDMIQVTSDSIKLFLYDDRSDNEGSFLLSFFMRQIEHSSCYFDQNA